jgi:hypothetical protein
MCPAEFVVRLEELNGKLVIWTHEGVVTLEGVELKFDGGYKSSFKWW